MKGSEQFQQTIQNWITANQPDLLTTEGKSIEKCVSYILHKVKESGINGFADDEVYAMAVEYYSTENIVVGDAPSGSVVVNHHVEAPKAAAPKAAAPKVTEQGSLF